MPPKNRIPGLTTDPKTGGWKYQKRVPEDVQSLVGKKSWGERLGDDYAAAAAKALRLEEENLATIARFRDPEVVESELRGGVLQAAAAMVEFSKDKETFASDFHWSQAAQQMRSRDHLEPDERAEFLRLLLAISFGETAQIEAFPPANPHNAALLKKLGAGAPPTNPTDLIMFNAMREAVSGQITKLPVKRRSDSSDTLLKLLDRYSGLQSLSENTRRAYARGIQRFIDNVGDLDVRDITSRMLKDHRDHLVASGIEPTSIRTLFAGIGSVLAFAQDEELIEVNPTLGMKFPRDTKSIEDRKHLPFRRDEVSKIWTAAQERFNPDGDSRLSKDRRRAYLMCVKTLFLTGMRPHEFFRLRNFDVCDVSQLDDYHDEWKGIGIDICFSKCGNRLIPLPDALADLPDFIGGGGLDCIRDVSNIENKFSDKQFNPLLTSLGIKRPRVSLYSTRATFNMALKRNGVSLEVRQQIIGHKPDGQMMRHYTDAETMTTMADAMNSVTLW
ncbi:tyrosine-type recombinase/integrase [Sulfitobacter aestuarii]|uniref:Tyrosine-type recombinase/integrase n=1 Tax=Sulfitobacter aestuarii TaxID=2161676 RepID=A0ABW5U691_9RHOB